MSAQDDVKKMPLQGGRITRRRFVAGSAAVGLATIAAPRIVRADGGKITVLNWQGYGTDEAWALEAFKKKTGIEVVHDYFNSEPEMVTKLRTNPGAYDVVLTNCAWNGVASKEGLVQAIDTSKIGGFKDLTPGFRESKLLNDGGKTYGVAWVWGMTAIAYNTEVFKQTPESIGVLWDTKEAKRVAFRDDGIEAVSFAAIATGQDINHPKDIAKIKEKLLALKGQVATLWSSEDEFNKLFSAKTFDISPYWSGSAARSKSNFKLPVGYVVPKEGAIGWFDGLAIANKAPNVAGAEKFIAYMIDPDFYYTWATKVGAPASANPKANDKLPADDVAKKIHSDKAAIKRLQYMGPLSDEERQSYSDLWTEVKAEFAK
ncbi:MAG TPA: extracellular solute-binding protein [Dongiaceae bacterium]